MDKTETGVDGVSSLNLEDDRDNERKLREEQLIATMEDQVSSNLGGGNTSDSSDRSVESSPSRQKEVAVAVNITICYIDKCPLVDSRGMCA